jgi:hypothetical protein
MNTLQKDQKPRTSQPKGSPIPESVADLMKMAKPIGTFGGVTDFILRFRKGEFTAADTGDQGGGQN